MPRSRLFLLAGLFSLLAVLSGMWAALHAGVPASIALRNPAAWVIGLAAAIALSRLAGRSVLLAVPVMAAGALLASLFGPGIEGVHRWIGLGPLTLNAAMLVLPAMTAATAALVAASRRPVWVWLLPLIALAALVTQPDASQASAFGLVIAVLALGRAKSGLVGKCVAMGAGLLVAAAWYRPDPLAPVAEVEEIHALAFAVSPLLAGVLLGSLFLFCLVPVWTGFRSGRAGLLTAGPLSLYFIVQAAMPFFGAYPVPLAGMGVSAILGAWLGLGVLAAGRRMSGDPP